MTKNKDYCATANGLIVYVFTHCKLQIKGIYETQMQLMCFLLLSRRILFTYYCNCYLFSFEFLVSASMFVSAEYQTWLADFAPKLAWETNLDLWEKNQLIRAVVLKKLKWYTDYTHWNPLQVCWFATSHFARFYILLT